METTKTKHFTEKQSEIATISKAMGHPARVAIIDLLLKVNTYIGNDILEKIPLAQPTISQHLKVLKDEYQDMWQDYCILYDIQLDNNSMPVLIENIKASKFYNKK